MASGNGAHTLTNDYDVLVISSFTDSGQNITYSGRGNVLLRNVTVGGASGGVGRLTVVIKAKSGDVVNGIYYGQAYGITYN